MKHIGRKRLIISIVSIVAAIILIGIIFVSTTQKSVLIITGSDGGMCPNGPCGGDDAVVYTNGTYTNHEAISSDDITRLKQLIDSFDPSTYSVNGDCGSSTFDGSDPYVKFPQKTGDMQYEPCGVVYNANNPRPNPIKEIFSILNSY